MLRSRRKTKLKACQYPITSRLSENTIDPIPFILRAVTLPAPGLIFSVFGWISIFPVRGNVFTN